MSIEKQKEVIKKEIEKLNEKLQLLETTGRELPNLSETYYFIDTESEFNIRADSYEGFSQEMDNYKEFNYFTDKNKAMNRLKQIRNYFKVMCYLELVNGDWKPDLSFENLKVRANKTFKEDSVQIKLSEYFLNDLDMYLVFKNPQALNLFREYITDEEIRLFLFPMGVKTNG